MSMTETVFTIELTGKEIAMVTAVLDAMMEMTPSQREFCEAILAITNKIVEQVNEQAPK